jgi:hypothetical protein
MAEAWGTVPWNALWTETLGKYSRTLLWPSHHVWTFVLHFWPPQKTEFERELSSFSEMGGRWGSLDEGLGDQRQGKGLMNFKGWGTYSRSPRTWRRSHQWDGRIRRSSGRTWHWTGHIYWLSPPAQRPLMLRMKSILEHEGVIRFLQNQLRMIILVLP